MVGSALVTGGARRIGRAICERLAAEGYAVVIHASARSLNEAGELAKILKSRGARACALACDLGDPESVTALLPAAGRALGPVSLLVNNASIFEDDDASQFNPACFDRHLAINLRAPVQLTSLFAASLPEGLEGAVVNVVDQRVWRLTPDHFSYTISKAALWAATQTLAQRFAPRLRINAVGPGPVLPNNLEGGDGFAREVATAPLGRAVAPEEVAEAVVYLAGAQSVTGQMIAVDSGQHIAWRAMRG